MRPSRWLSTATGLVCLIGAAKLALHLYAAGNYGYFVDELYYLACGEHLAWGYVDQPPLIALIAFLVRHTLGDSLFAIHLLPAISGAAKVVLTAWIAREMGGRRFAQVLAAICVMVAPGFLATDSFFSMNTLESLLWTAGALVIARIVRTGNQRLWIWFGLIAGIGLENKHSMLIFGAGVMVGLVLTAERRALRFPWIWIAGVVATLIFLPNLVWNIQNHFPFLELQANIRRNGRNVDLTPLTFFVQQFLTLQPFTGPVWLAGLWFYFRVPSGRPFRIFGWIWIVSALLIVILNPRVYYLYPAFPLLMAGGAVMWEQWLAAPRWNWVRFAWPALLLIVGALFAPFAVPLLPPETYIRYSRAMFFSPPAIEKWKLGPLPQLFADRFGWEEMTVAVARVYHELPPEVRSHTAIFGQNYGQAGAIDLFGPRYGLPKAISGHQNYFLWGPHDFDGDSIIVMHGRQQDLEQSYRSVTKVASVGHPYSMPYEHFDVFYCRSLKWPVRDVWLRVKNWN